MIRVLVCLLMFGLGAQALGGGTFGVIVSGAIALAINWKWKQVNAQERRQRVIDDEQLRLEVRERRRQP